MQSLLGDELSVDSYGPSGPWLMYTYDSVAGSYRLVGLPERLSANTGYWLFQRTGAEVTLDIPQSVPALTGGAITGCIAGIGDNSDLFPKGDNGPVP